MYTSPYVKGETLVTPEETSKKRKFQANFQVVKRREKGGGETSHIVCANANMLVNRLHQKKATKATRITEKNPFKDLEA